MREAKDALIISVLMLEELRDLVQLMFHCKSAEAAGEISAVSSSRGRERTVSDLELVQLNQDLQPRTIQPSISSFPCIDGTSCLTAGSTKTLSPASSILRWGTLTDAEGGRGSVFTRLVGLRESGMKDAIACERR
jgi:hypothetical protein